MYRSFTKGTKDSVHKNQHSSTKYCVVEDEDFMTVHNRTFETQNQSKSISLEQKTGTLEESKYVWRLNALRRHIEKRFGAQVDTDLERSQREHSTFRSASANARSDAQGHWKS